MPCLEEGGRRILWRFDDSVVAVNEELRAALRLERDISEWKRVFLR